MKFGILGILVAPAIVILANVQSLALAIVIGVGCGLTCAILDEVLSR